ncbi:ABC transporter permease [Geothrix rubra]|uniref:ABC transporter permease n=1 Tax=Geothrix rubra TaxID=2927977 RepID=A0ABQ5Q3A8_9BACT|nr:ABC transporter permease [Geothrix rubra]GLH68801.1 ABC transporter permease [Geothrix rubra]
MTSSGAFRERLLEAWMEIRENLGRASLQALGVLLGVASVLGGFSISDSQRQRAEQLYVRLGGLDKLNVQPRATVRDGQATALQQANLGLRDEDATDGDALRPDAIQGVSSQKNARSRVVSGFADQDRPVTGIGGDFIPANGYAVEAGRGFSASELEAGAPVAILGTEAAATFFPSGSPLGQVLRIGEVPVTVIGTFQERVFRFREDQRNIFRWRNRIIAVPANLVQRRMNGDAYRRVDRITFRIPDLKVMAAFSKQLQDVVTANHRLQDDFRLDDVQARIRRQNSQGDVYDLIFLLSGVLALVGGGIVNVNIQMASLKERVREVGVKMALGASGREIFKGFMTEALLLTALGALAGLVLGVGFSWTITRSLGVPLAMTPASFIWAYVMASLSGFLFALYPAWKASRLSPMEALRYE